MSGWGNIRIIVGTLGGGMLGFYVAHHADLAYKKKVKEEIARLEKEHFFDDFSLGDNNIQEDEYSSSNSQKENSSQ